MYAGPDIQTALSYPHTREKIADTCTEDIYDGALYSKMKSENVLNHDTISLKHNMDGISVFHSSGKDVWPIFFQINELPPIIRY